MIRNAFSDALTISALLSQLSQQQGLGTDADRLKWYVLLVSPLSRKLKPKQEAERENESFEKSSVVLFSCLLDPETTKLFFFDLLLFFFFLLSPSCCKIQKIQKLLLSFL